MCAKNPAIYILEEAYSACASIFKEYIKEAYLYGSYARGDYSKESDVDILVTVALDRAELSKYRSSCIGFERFKLEAQRYRFVGR